MLQISRFDYVVDGVRRRRKRAWRQAEHGGARRQRGQETTGAALRADAVLHAVALAFDDQGLGVMQDAVQEGRGQRAVIVEDRRPVLVDLVGRQHYGAALVAMADDLEQQVGPALVNGQIYSRPGVWPSSEICLRLRCRKIMSGMS